MSSPPPPKRRRRLVIASSSEDENDEYNADSTIQTAEQRRKNNGTLLLPSRTRGGAPTSTSRAHNAVISFPPSSSPKPPKTLHSRPVQLPPPQLPTTPQKRRSTRTTRSGSVQTSTPGSSLEKKRAKTKKTESLVQSTSLHSFFQLAPAEQRWSRDGRGSTSGGGNGGKNNNKGRGRDVISIPEAEEEEGVEEIEDEEEEDFIEDDSFDEIFTQHVIEEKNAVVPSSLVKNRQLRNNNKLGGKSEAKVKAKSSGAKKRFLLPESPVPGDTTLPTSTPLITEGSRPWAEEFGPTTLDELAVHKRKVTDVQNWLVDVFTQRSRQRILVLRGPAGSGKTTTLSLLSKSLGFDVIEWKNSLGSDPSSLGYTSNGTQFEDFLGRSDKFGSLDLGNESSVVTNGVGQLSSPDVKPRVIVVEEFPTSLSQSSSGLKAFRGALQRYLAATMPQLGFSSRRGKSNNQPISPPIVIIVSETMLDSAGALSDSFTVHRLLGPEISNHPGVNIIEFNKIAPSFILKALDLVLKKEARRSKRKRIPGPGVLTSISEIGDVRNAISMLEFLCLRGGEQQGWGGTVAGRMKKSGKAGVPLTSMEKKSLEMVTQREASLGIFHAVGRVVYNKREDPTIAPVSEKCPRLPSPPEHLQQHTRPKVSQVSVDDLVNETGTDIQTFIAALHENFVLSCGDGPALVDTYERCMSELSDTDILGPDSRRNLRSTRGGVGSAANSSLYQGYGTSLDILRQEEISFQVAVRGLLFSLPYPVNRKAPSRSTRRAGDQFKMFFPTSMRLWRQEEEMNGLLDVWMRRLADPAANIATSGATSGATSTSGGVESWKKRAGMISGSSGYDTEHDTSPIAARALASRDEVLLERLPYLTQISKNVAEIEDLERIVQFHGIGGPNQDISDDEADLFDEIPLTAGLSSPQKRKPAKLGVFEKQQPSSGSSNVLAPTPTLMVPVEEAVDKLVLSDDDIEDD
ncbi:hypothetical protein AJ80_06970 [Polytolypa hystricis UAMH7299]|uniref:Checkpoint protein RAD24-like helical bundle domain-containing protein n=1 Tax=Polytolypa hystricis (strain UAMH7299) TaxID=1447883 RepID=A0A2B7XT38_POLH7|nr:hypothetical protein AJ80_06970 [Polytolypa hystricis UAMH7299]